MPDPARDQFVRYFTEKLWDWIPAIYRDLDGLAARPHALRAIVQGIAEQVAVARRNIDRAWDNQSIEHCDDWSVPYIGDLVGTRLVPALNYRARRVDVARTIFYRRRSGTLHVLAELFTDMTGWDGVVVESFRRLGRTAHGLDPQPRAVGRYTRTPMGAVADLRCVRGVELAHGPWDELSHTADLRQHRGHAGRYGIPKLNHHIYRMLAHQVVAPTPYSFTTRRFTFDPSGRDTPLFMPSTRVADVCRERHEWDVAGPIRCRLLGHAEYEITETVLAAVDDVVPDAPSMAKLATFLGVRFRDEFRLRDTLASLDAPLLITHIYTLLASALTDDSAKAALVRDAPAFMITEGGPATQIPPERTSAGNLATWGASITDIDGKRLYVDPVRGRYWFAEDPPPAISAVAHYFYGFSGEVGAGTYDRREAVLTTVDGTFSGGGTIVPPDPWENAYTITDSKTYIVPDVAFFTDLTLQSASQQRPYLRRHAAEGTMWVFGTDVVDAKLTLEGLWYGGGTLVLRGDYARVTIRHCTLDPGGTRADDSVLLPAPIVIMDHVDELIVEHSIIAGVVTSGTGTVASLILRDSIVQSSDPAAKINLPGAELTFERSTIAVETIGLRINASEIVAQRPIDVLDHQRGCVRYSVIAPLSHTPPVYHGSVEEVRPSYFVSQRFGDPGYHVLSETAPELLLRGAENGSEIGAYAKLTNPLKLDSLRAKVHEFLPFGRVAAFIREN
jgi:hypothetical protein